MAVLIQIFSGIGHFQRHQVHHFGYRNPLVIKILVLHGILQTDAIVPYMDLLLKLAVKILPIVSPNCEQAVSYTHLRFMKN